MNDHISKFFKFQIKKKSFCKFIVFQFTNFSNFKLKYTPFEDCSTGISKLQFTNYFESEIYNVSTFRIEKFGNKDILKLKYRIRSKNVSPDWIL